MFLAGFNVPDLDVLELAHIVDDPGLAERLEGAYGRGVRVFALQITDRFSIFRALEEPPTKALAELRAFFSPSMSAASATGSVRANHGDPQGQTQLLRLLRMTQGNNVSEVAAVLLGGVPIEDRQVLQIAGLVDQTLGSKLVRAYRLHFPVVALTSRERDAIRAALETAPGLHYLRDALAAEEAT